MKLNIIECDELHPDLTKDYCGYGRMFEQYLGSLDSEITFQHFSAIKRQLPKTVTPQDVYLLTGSKYGAYEDDTWIKELISWVTKAYEAGGRFIGICFGHQILAQALGGKVEKSNKGWGLGVRTVPTYNSITWENYDKKTISLIYVHQDQVIELPAKASIIAGDDFCPVAGFRIDNQVITFQGHPEFNELYARRLLELREERFEKTLYQSSVASLSSPTDATDLGRLMIRWVKEPGSPVN
ncbi:glutamine amidotransferase-related protein [Gynuella sp.]|uniref:glutamine amidotransferase-related protein n=1 Tax=Gynuella sp. TaxID=2969146 RepID=UPI003D0E1C3E